MTAKIERVKGSHMRNLNEKERCINTSRSSVWYKIGGLQKASEIPLLHSSLISTDKVNCLDTNA